MKSSDHHKEELSGISNRLITTTFTTRVGDNDVILGRGKTLNNHVGNIRFRNLVAKFKTAYRNASRAKKPLVAVKVVHAWRTMFNGRFLDKHGDSPYWYDVGDATAQKRAARCLRRREDSDSSLVDDSDDEEEVAAAVPACPIDVTAETSKAPSIDEAKKHSATVHDHDSTVMKNKKRSPTIRRQEDVLLVHVDHSLHTNVSSTNKKQKKENSFIAKNEASRAVAKSIIQGEGSILALQQRRSSTATTGNHQHGTSSATGSIVDNKEINAGMEHHEEAPPPASFPTLAPPAHREDTVAGVSLQPAMVESQELLENLPTAADLVESFEMIDK